MERIQLSSIQVDLLQHLDFNELPPALLEGGGTFKEEQRGRLAISYISDAVKETPSPEIEEIYEITAPLLLDAIVSPHLRRGILVGLQESAQAEAVRAQLDRVRSTLLTGFSSEPPPKQ